MSLIVVSRLGEKPGFLWRVCGTQLGQGEYERHVVRCSKRHEEELRARSWRVKNPYLFDPNVVGDVEFERWVQANRKAILDGRKKM